MAYGSAACDAEDSFYGINLVGSEKVSIGDAPSEEKSLRNLSLLTNLSLALAAGALLM